MQNKNQKINFKARRKAIALILFGLIFTVIPLAYKRIVELFNPIPKPVFKDFRFRIGKYIQGKAIREPGRAESLSFDLGKGITLEMISIKPGEFNIGSPKNELGRNPTEGLQYLIDIKNFGMGRFPVTQAQWEAVANLPQVARYLNPKPSTFDGATRPVETVSWEEAVEFCERLTDRFKQFGYQFRLPSEAEWEYACRANTETPFYFGESIAPDLANYDVHYKYTAGRKGTKAEYQGQTTIVKKYDAANAFGLEDMHGNVWEWCADYWYINHIGTPLDGSPRFYNQDFPKSRVLRGGSWHNFPTSCRSASRNWKPQNFKSNTIGFRVACKKVA